VRWGVKSEKVFFLGIMLNFGINTAVITKRLLQYIFLNLITEGAQQKKESNV